MKRNHPVDVAANATMVRHVLERLIEANDCAPVEVCTRGLETVERWVAGEEVTTEMLNEVGGAAHSLHRPLFREHTKFGLAWAWACSAVGNLCWMAQKERGWTDANRTIMDSAAYASTSLAKATGEVGRDAHPTEVELATRKRLEELRQSALDAALRVTKKSKRARPPRFRRPAGLERLGLVVAARMERLRARVDPRLVVDEDALRALLAERGFPVHPAVLAFDRRYAGIVMAESPGEVHPHWLFGSYACLVGGMGGTGRADLVPVGCSQSDYFLYLDGEGAAWGLSSIDSDTPARIAPNADAMLARTVLYGVSAERHFRGKRCTIDGRHGARIARELGIEAVRPANDRTWRAWADSRRLVIEHLVDGAPCTVVAAPGAKRLAN